MVLVCMKIYSLHCKLDPLEFIGNVKVQVGGFYSHLRQKFEQVGLIDWSFDFWDVKDNYRSETNLEHLSTSLAKVHVVHDPTICNAIF